MKGWEIRKVDRLHRIATVRMLEVTNYRNQLDSKEKNHYLLHWNIDCKILRKKAHNLFQQIWILVYVTLNRDNYDSFDLALENFLLRQKGTLYFSPKTFKYPCCYILATLWLIYKTSTWSFTSKFIWYIFLLSIASAPKPTVRLEPSGLWLPLQDK